MYAAVWSSAALSLLAGAMGGTAFGVGVGLAARQMSAGRPGPPLWVTAALQAGLSLWAFTRAETPWAMAVSILLSAILLTLALVDLATLRIPDVITLPLIAGGLGAGGLGGIGLANALAGAVTGGVAIVVLAWGFRRFRGRDGIGMGDAKLLAAAGAWLGWRSLPWMVLLACGLAFAWAGARALRRGRASLSRPLPFGPPLALAFWVVWLHGAPP